MNRICSTCKEEKPRSHFFRDRRNKSGLCCSCKTCARDRAREWRARPENRNKEKQYYQKWRSKPGSIELQSKRSKLRYAKQLESGSNIQGWLLKKYEGTPCLDCGVVFPFCAMDFHHRPDEIKSFRIGSQGSLNTTTERVANVEKEITKCNLLCACCHRVRTRDGT